MNTTARARQLRRDQTWAEKKLWRLLRERRFAGYKFRRQHPFDQYFLDFYCPEARLVIELDGGGHGHPEQQAHDAARDALLRAQGIEVKRIWNRKLLTELEWVRQDLWQLLQARAPHPGNVPPEKRITSRVLNPDRPAGENSPSPYPSPHPMGRGNQAERFS